jgi:Predicted nucleic-acid-binding protein containing a Zn-ribbon
VTRPIKSVHPEAEYAAFLAEGRFMVQRSASTGEAVFFPRVAQPVTGRDDLEWVEASGAGSLYSFTVVRNKPPAADYIIGLVDLNEGVRMMSRLIDCHPESLSIGMPLQAKIGDVDGVPAVLFQPVEGASA